MGRWYIWAAAVLAALLLATAVGFSFLQWLASTLGATAIGLIVTALAFSVAPALVEKVPRIIPVVLVAALLGGAALALLLWSRCRL